MVITPHLTLNFRSTTSSTGATNVPLATPGTQQGTSRGIELYGVNIINGSTSAIYAKFYSSTAATTATVPQFTLAVAAGVGSETLLRGADISETFANGCSYRITTGLGDTDATAADAAPIVELKYCPT